MKLTQCIVNSFIALNYSFTTLCSIRCSSALQTNAQTLNTGKVKEVRTSSESETHQRQNDKHQNNSRFRSMWMDLDCPWNESNNWYQLWSWYSNYLCKNIFYKNAWTRSPSTSPLGVGLETPPSQIPLNFPLGCGPGNLQGMLGYHSPWRPAARHAGIPPAMHAGLAPPLNRMTDRCKNITLPYAFLLQIEKSKFSTFPVPENRFYILNSNVIFESHY